MNSVSYTREHSLKFTMMSLSIAVLTNESQQYHKIEEISNAVAAIKRNCKKIKGAVLLSIKQIVVSQRQHVKRIMHRMKKQFSFSIRFFYFL